MKSFLSFLSTGLDLAIAASIGLLIYNVIYLLI